MPTSTLPRVPPLLLAFVRSRIPMVEHDFSEPAAESHFHEKQRRAWARYAISQGFFYAADLWVNKPPLVSAKALAYANDHWGDQAHKVWTLKRADIPRLDGCKISESGLIYEHVTTGGMFRRFIQAMLAQRSGVLDPWEVAMWVQDNFQTAWVTRGEDKNLTSAGYRTNRGETLSEALAAYSACGIELSDRPNDIAPNVLFGETHLDSAMDGEGVQAEGDLTGIPSDQPLPTAGGNYSLFFDAVAAALTARNSQISLAHDGNRHYAKVIGLNTAGVREAVLLLDAPRGVQVRSPVLSLEAVTSQPGNEPNDASWVDLRDTLEGPEWSISFGRANSVPNALCRCKRTLAHAFEVADATAREAAAARTAVELDAHWTVFNG